MIDNLQILSNEICYITVSIDCYKDLDKYGSVVLIGCVLDRRPLYWIAHSSPSRGIQFHIYLIRDQTVHALIHEMRRRHANVIQTSRNHLFTVFKNERIGLCFDRQYVSHILRWCISKFVKLTNCIYFGPIEVEVCHRELQLQSGKIILRWYRHRPISYLYWSSKLCIPLKPFSNSNPRWRLELKVSNTPLCVKYT